MRKQILQSRTSRALARVLVATQVLSAVPALAAEPGAAPAAAVAAAPLVDPAAPPVTTPPPPPPQVTVNRTVPRVDPVPLFAAFSMAPTAAEITNARVFGEPLFPIGGTPTPEENAALAKAIQEFQRGGDVEDVTPFGTFLTSYPDTAWRASVLAGLGSLYRRTGYFTRAIEVLDEAWQLVKGEQGRQAEATGFAALSDLLEVHMQFGQVEPLDRLLADVGDRTLTGSVTESVKAANATTWGLRNKHEDAIPSGPVALDRIRAFQGKGNARHAESMKFAPTHDGAGLDEMADLAGRMQLGMKIARRQQGARIVFPSLMHLKQGHFTAVVREEKGRYLLDDPLLDGEFWMSRAALEEESSGFFLVPDGALPPGWTSVAADQVRTIRGKCKWATPDGGATNPSNGKSGGGPGPAFVPPNPQQSGLPRMCPPRRPSPALRANQMMASYGLHYLTANLHITDAPMGYDPPRGPAVSFGIHYNHREYAKPTTFTFANAGPRWVFDWVSYIEDNPSAPGGTVKVHYRGGGSDTFTGVGGAGSAYQILNRSQVALVSSSPIRYERRLADGSVEVFAQADGAMTMPRRLFMTEVRDPQGEALGFTYDSQLRLVGVSDAIGQVSTVSYELSTDPLKITRVTDPFGRSARLDYNADGKMWRITDTVGIQSSIEYGQGDFVHSLTTPYGTSHFSMPPVANNKADFSIEATDALGGTERVMQLYGSALPAQDPANLVPVGFSNNSSLHLFNSFYWSKRALASHPGDYTKAHVMKWRALGTYKFGDALASSKGPSGNRLWFEHSGGAWPNSVGIHGRPIRVGKVLGDGTSQISAYEYNGLGGVTRYTDPKGRESTYEFGANGIDVTAVKRKEGGVMALKGSLGYDSSRRPVSATNASGAVRSFGYTPQGQLSTVTAPAPPGHSAGLATSFTYNSSGYLTQIEGPVAGVATQLTYDGYGRPRTITGPTSYTLTVDYDDADRPTRVTHPDGTYEETTYDRLNAGLHRDRRGRTTQLFQDALGRSTGSRSASGAVTQISYLEGCGCNSSPRSLTDPKGNTTTWDYDDEGRVIGESRTGGGSRTYVYDSATDRLTQFTDPAGRVFNFEYDTDDQTKAIKLGDGTVVESWTYDPDTGLVKTDSNALDTLTWNYDSDDRVTSEVSSYNGSTVSYGYDAAGYRTSMSLNGVAFASYTWDDIGRLQGIQRGAQTFGFGYDTLSRRTSLTYPNGIVTTYAFDDQSRLTSLLTKLGTTPITSFGYTYDTLGNRTTKTTLDWVETYGYDQENRLESVDRSAGTPQRWRFDYDDAGNRTTQQVDDTVLTATIAAPNRLMSLQPGGSLRFGGSVNEPATMTVQGQAATVAGTGSFAGQASVNAGTTTVPVTATDASGNLRTNTYEVDVSGSGTTYHYDLNGNLDQKVEGGVTWTYEWNVTNQLKRVLNNGAEVARYSYDPLGRRVEKVAGGITTSYVYDGSDILRENRGGTIATYIQGPGIDEPLAKETAGTMSYLHADGLGSVVKITDQAAAATSTLRYDAWGNIEAGTPDLYAFTGRELDAESGLYYYRARYYDPKIGRFISEDPVVDDINLYGYVHANPVVFTDPLGLMDHHVVPGGVFRKQPLRPGVRAILELHVIEAGTHRFWEPHRRLNGAVQDLWDDAFRGIAPQDITEDMIWKFIRRVEADPEVAILTADILKRGGVRTMPPWIKKCLKVAKAGGRVLGLLFFIIPEVVWAGEPLDKDPDEE